LKNELRKLKGTCVDTKFEKSSILGKPVLQPHRNQSVVRQPTAFKSERCKFSKPRFASQVDVINDLSKPVTPHYVPKVRESVFVKPHHVIASGSSRNSSNESYGSNDMAHKYYLETRNINKLVEPKSHTRKPDRQIAIGQRFSLNKSFVVRKKPNTPRSCLRWIPTGRIFKTAGLRWIPTGNMFIDSTTKVDSEPPNGSNEDITNPYECKQSLDGFKTFKSFEHVKGSLNTAVQVSDLNVNKMASADNTSGLALQRKERCTLQCALSLEEEKSSCLRPFSSTSFMLFHARSVISLLNAACKKYLYLLKKGLMVMGKLRQLPYGEYRDGLQIANIDKMTVPLSV
nr:hypothetical protein [Tanacetum cinerariifolium]